MSEPLFARAAPEYAAMGIATFPVGGDDGKRPLVQRYKAFRANSYKKVSPKFFDSNVGICCGPASGLTVIDIDTQEQSELQWSLETFGSSPIVVRTGSGKHHIYYRHDGERRRIRPFPGHEIDLLGEGGFSVAPPSVRPGGEPYRFIRGGLSDWPSLPTIRKGVVDDLLRQCAQRSERPRPTSPAALAAPPGAILEGGRNDWLFARALGQAALAPTLEVLVADLLKINEDQCHPPLMEMEIRRTAKTVWSYKQQNRLWTPGGQQHIALDMATIEPLLRAGDANALMMYTRLKMAHGHRPGTFAASPDAMAKGQSIGGWSPKRIRSSISDLGQYGLLERVTTGGRGKHDPAQYRFSTPHS